MSTPPLWPSAAPGGVMQLGDRPARVTPHPGSPPGPAVPQGCGPAAKAGRRPSADRSSCGGTFPQAARSWIVRRRAPDASSRAGHATPMRCRHRPPDRPRSTGLRSAGKGAALVRAQEEINRSRSRESGRQRPGPRPKASEAPKTAGMKKTKPMPSSGSDMRSARKKATRPRVPP